jgi:hypothetical protein
MPCIVYVCTNCGTSLDCGTNPRSDIVQVEGYMRSSSINLMPSSLSLFWASSIWLLYVLLSICMTFSARINRNLQELMIANLTELSP